MCMKKENNEKVNNNELHDDSVKEESLHEIDNKEEDFLKSKKEKEEKKIKINKKFICLIILFVLVLFILAVLLITLLGKRPSEKELEENFNITSIEPQTDGNYIDNNETFILKTSKANEEIVRKHLYIEPPVNYEIQKVNSKEYKVLVSDIPSDSLVNLSLIKDQVKSYSWAFQSTKDLKVVDVYPTNGASTVSTSSVINIVFKFLLKLTESFLI